jgi:hypothetical protein
MYVYRNEKEKEEKAAPDHAWPISPETVIEYGTYHGGQSYDDGDHNHYGKCYENLIQKV